MPIAIQSVLGQKNFSGELIIVDDGSNDGTKQAIEKYTNGDHADIIRYIKTDHRGVAAARNRGVGAACYDLIAFLDSDDHWKSDKLEKQDRWLSDHAAYSICHTFEKWYRLGQHLNQKKIHIPRHGDIFSHCVQLCAVGMSTVLMKKELFLAHGGFDESLPCCEDYDLWIRIASKNHFLLLPEPLTIKEGGRKDQLSQYYRMGMDKYRIYALSKLLCSANLDAEKIKIAEEALNVKCMVYGKGCRKYGREEEAQIYLDLPERIREGCSIEQLFLDFGEQK